MLSNKMKMGDKLNNIDLFEKLTPDIKKYFLSLGLNNETSEDLSQDVFIKMAESYADRKDCLLYTSPSPRDATLSRMPSSA